VDDVAESVEGVVDELVKSVLENTIMEMAREVACVCVSKRMLLMSRSFGAEGRLDVCFLSM